MLIFINHNQLQMKLSKLLIAASLCLTVGAQSKAELIEFYADNKIKWEVNTSTGTAKVLNLISYSVNNPDVVLPEYVNYQGRDYKVTAIGKLACINNGLIQSLKVSKYVEMIDSAAFTGSSKLTKVELNDGLKQVCIRAFAGCSVLADINIPSSVNHIGAYSLQGTKLTTFHFPATVTYIGDNPFRSSTSLQTITVDEANPNYCAKDGVLFTKDMRRLICFPSGNGVANYTIPEGVVTIGDNSMRNNAALKAVTMPTSLEAIGEMAFGLSGLTEVNISKNVKYIGPAAFYMMSSLTAFNVDAANAWYKGENGMLLSKDGKLLVASVMKTGDFTIPAGIEKIGKYAFYGNTGLTSVNFGAVKEIGTHSFYNCSNIASLDFGQNLELIDTMAFQNCRGITELHFPASLRKLKMQAFCYASAVTKIEFNQGLDYIGNMTFYGCNALKSIELPGSVRFEGASFYCCAGLQTVTLGEGIEEISSLCFSNCNVLRSVKVPSTLKIIGEASFQLCPMLRKFDFPEGLAVIDRMAFNRSGMRGEIRLPNSLETLGEWAFASNKGITSVVTNNNLKSLENHTFHGCASIKEVKLNDGLQFIGVNALSIIDSLTLLVVPSTVTRMDSLCINYNTNMENLVLKPTTPPAVDGLLAHYIDMKKDGVDWNPYTYTTLHVPEGCVDAYRNHPEWGRFQNIVGDANGVEATTDDADAYILDVYDINGIRIAEPLPGRINIIRWSNGKVTKEYRPLR